MTQTLRLAITLGVLMNGATALAQTTPPPATVPATPTKKPALVLYETCLPVDPKNGLNLTEVTVYVDYEGLMKGLLSGKESFSVEAAALMKTLKPDSKAADVPFILSGALDGLANQGAQTFSSDSNVMKVSFTLEDKTTLKAIDSKGKAQTVSMTCQESKQD